MGPLDLVNLTPLMERTSGRAEIKVGLIDGPVAMDHADFVRRNMQEVPGKLGGTCSRADSVACMHGTLVAGVLCAKRGSVAAAVCPGCTLLVRPIFAETASTNEDMPTATPEELASAIIETVNAGAQVINLSAALVRPSPKGEHELEEALNYAARHNVIIVVAAGNQGSVGSSVITRHLWAIPVAACDLQGRLTAESNLGSSIGRHGLTAPGKDITSLGANGKPQTFGGTSAAVPFVVGAIALLWSEFPSASAAQVKLATIRAGGQRRKAIAPPLLDAWAAFEAMNPGGEKQR
jgi:subtilisin family serine protease